MPCTACGSAPQEKNSYQINKPKKQTTNKVVYLTPQQIAMIQARRRACMRTLVFT